MCCGMMPSFAVTTKTANHPKPSETTQNVLQPITNYPELAMISFKPAETPNSQSLNAFGMHFII